MKCVIPEISWHNRDPVLSLDIQPMCNEFYRLVTGGADCHVLIWQLKVLENGKIDIDVMTDLTRHQKAVNAVRWSPSGQNLASADDDANVIIWHLKTDNIPILDGDNSDKEVWLVYKILRGHKEDIYDLCWSPNGLKLLTGSIDNTAILWDFEKGKLDYILTAHKGFVQGVSWDPKGQFIATISSDRVCRLFDKTGKQPKLKAYKGKLPVPETHSLYNKEIKYFHDDTFKSYFRRLDFSPDGNLLVVPSGCVETEDCKKALHATYIFTLDSFTRPVAILPSPKHCTVAVKCCPVLFELRPDGPDPIIRLPYRMIIAVATDSDVILYDTQQITPFAHFQKIHYTRLTDLTWSKDGLLLIASSTDGYCTLVTFEADELGIQYTKEDSEVEGSVLNISGCEELENEETEINKKEESEETKKLKRPSFIQQWATKAPKQLKFDQSKTDCDESKDKNLPKQNINRLTPRRITPIKLPDEAMVSKNNINETVTPNTNSVQQKVNKQDSPKGKQSLLLNFVKKTPKKTGKKNEKKTKINDVCVVVDETEARDAWKCEGEEKVEDKPGISDLICISDASNEDTFKLELESTNTDIINSNNEVDENPENLDSKENKNSLNNCDIKNQVHTDGTSDEMICNKNNVGSNDNNGDTKIMEVDEVKEKTVDTLVVEKPIQKKRIPLITLSSPKAKCKKKQGDSS